MLKQLFGLAIILISSVSFAQCKDFSGNFESTAKDGKVTTLNHKQIGCESITTSSNERRSLYQLKSKQEFAGRITEEINAQDQLVRRITLESTDGFSEDIFNRIK